MMNRLAEYRHQFLRKNIYAVRGLIDRRLATEKIVNTLETSLGLAHTI